MHQFKEQLPETPGEDELGVRPIGQEDAAVDLPQTPAGTNPAPAPAGPPGDPCQCPHWGYVLEGAVHVRRTNGSEETIEAGEVYYRPAGHTVRYDEDAKFVEFSLEKGMREVFALIQGLGAADGASHEARAPRPSINEL